MLRRACRPIPKGPCCGPRARQDGSKFLRDRSGPRLAALLRARHCPTPFPPMAQVRLDSIGKVYDGDVRAVNDVNLEIADGEFVVLVGPSGCGKSTTLRMVAGLEEISEGTLTIGERVVNEVSPRDRNIAMVFQNYALYPHMSVRRNLSFGLERRRKFGNPFKALTSSEYRSQRSAESTAIAAQVEQAAETLGIAALLERHPKELSGGQRQRVAVGRALVRDPEVFLFDEPLSNLDAKLRIEMRGELRALHKSTGATMLYVTHDQEEAMTLGDRLVVMKDGVVQQCASPTEIYERPANRFVASFVGTPPMNFIEGRIDNGRFRAGQLDLPLPKNAPNAGEVVLGLRPDRIAPGGPGLEATAGLVSQEHLGDRMDLRLDLAGHKLIARCPVQSGLKEGQQVPIHVDMEQAHWFQPGAVGVNLLA